MSALKIIIYETPIKMALCNRNPRSPHSVFLRMFAFQTLPCAVLAVFCLDIKVCIKEIVLVSLDRHGIGSVALISVYLEH